MPVHSQGKALRVMRCARHAEREAVARCPACGGSFCRECVSEHDGKLLCATCLAKETAALHASKAPKAKRDWSRLWRVTRGVCAFLALWGFFFLLGELLLRIPPAFHEGTIWRSPFTP